MEDLSRLRRSERPDRSSTYQAPAIHNDELQLFCFFGICHATALGSGDSRRAILLFGIPLRFDCHFTRVPFQFLLSLLFLDRSVLLPSPVSDF